MSGTSEKSEANVLVGLLLGVSVLFFGSHVAYYISEILACDAVRTESPFMCFLANIASLISLLFAIPSSIFFYIVKFLTGFDSYSGNTALWGVLTVALAAYFFRKELFESGTIAASFTVTDAEPKPSLNELKRQAKEMENEIRRQDARSEMEDAIREMEEAKARLDELKKNQSS